MRLDRPHSEIVGTCRKPNNEYTNVAKSILPLIRYELPFQLFDDERPLNWFRDLVMIGNGIHDIRLQTPQPLKIIRLQKLLLQDTEPYPNLVQPRGVDRQSVDLDVQRPAVSQDLSLEPAIELLGCVCRAVVQNQDQGMDTARQGFRDSRPQQESLEVYKPLPQATLPINLSIGHAQTCP